MKNLKNLKLPSAKLCITLLGLISAGFATAQTERANIEANPKNWAAYQGKATFSGDSINLRVTGKYALLWLKNTNFKNGTVELDIKKGRNGLLGIAFHGLDNNRYDAVYFRPLNFRNPEKKDKAIQYINIPDNPWHKLRKESPGKYEGAVQPAPNPEDWFHAKITINHPEVKVYVNGSKEPSLAVKQISKRGQGKLGLWVDVDGNDGWFRNVTVIKDE